MDQYLEYPKHSKIMSGKGGEKKLNVNSGRNSSGMYYNWPTSGTVFLYICNNTGSRAKIHDRPCSLPQACAFDQGVDAGKVAAHQDFLRGNNN
jgi:hypothetical protein